MTDSLAPGPSIKKKSDPKNDDFMPTPKTRRISIFSAVRDLNLTAYPDRNYKNHLLEEAKQWKCLIRDAVEQSSSSSSYQFSNNSTPNVSYSQDISIVPKMKAYLDERPDIEAFLAENAKFYKRAESHLKRSNQAVQRFNSVIEQKHKLIHEISRDVRDDILLEC